MKGWAFSSIVSENRGGGGVLVWDEAEPVGAEGIGELVFERLAGGHDEAFEFAPLSGASEVCFQAEVERRDGIVGEGQAFTIIASGEVGVAGLVFPDGGVVPWELRMIDGSDAFSAMPLMMSNPR